ncbi:MAG: biotin carboxylase N-terminal domain-containing protein [Thermomicrobiales bacterium]
MKPPVLAIANRAEIAVRIARTARRLGWKPVVLLGEPDWDGFAAREIGSVVRLESGGEFDAGAVVNAARQAGAVALHPGYGFLSERPELSRRCAEAGITFVGPSPDTLQKAGDKIATREIAGRCGVPVLTGSPALNLDDTGHWLEMAGDIGYPVIAKVAGAGGGRGLRVARNSDGLPGAVQSAVNEAGGSGADAEIFLEHYLEGARHVEVQVAGDGRRAVVLGDRDCSLQRRHQKVVEEGPAPGLSDDLRSAIHEAAWTLAEGIELLNLATVEFLVGNDGRFFFMEINPRLQVEHTVTEEVTGFDLVALQIELAAGGDLPEPVPAQGHAIQARLYAEDPFQQFLPSPGHILQLSFPAAHDIPDATLRVDAGYAAGDDVPGSYDPMIAKVIVHAADRDAAVRGLTGALRATEIAGVSTNRPWLIAALAEGSMFRTNNHDLTTAGEVEIELGEPDEATLREVARALQPVSKAPSSAWESAGPFRIVAPATMTFHGDDSGGWQRTVAISPDESNDSTAASLVVPLNDGWEVVTPAGRWMVRPGPRLTRGAAAAAGDGEVRAPMPGKLLQIPVETGQEVAEGEVVAVLEAMKIEMSLAAPFDGTVAAVNASPGELVSLRQVVVTIQPLEPNSNGDSR